ncbi:hypothetical protein COV93_07040 [Candidatus Woesearchaeota archaeon CG11_big_fil_rev_8_21_14_0_20_43_8]|nr:MAG: hypothetical protein COV93_07040 [Candidatus Woesearchaeota archaeon CG11_big_fil_rev_8_21_14_0_20_43_8]PIO04946.1 MAG: hypothetical protein COT47_06875 [Candidatus Woesearchaeota archaeon CG08_land_8_20_14_0_20_43_7]
MEIKRFIEYFCDGLDINIVKAGNDFYHVPEETKKVLDKIPVKAESVGVFLGSSRGVFKPSLALLEMVAKKSDKKIFVDSNGEWLFVCKRDLMKKSISKAQVKTGLCLVQNSRDENIGLGKIVCKDISRSKPDEIVIKNVMNCGEYLGK